MVASHFWIGLEMSKDLDEVGIVSNGEKGLLRESWKEWQFSQA
jgi:hypothetical protein